jgi:Copper type II ascorbate-dependent monooxygenase, C-terminal domain
MNSPFHRLLRLPARIAHSTVVVVAIVSSWAVVSCSSDRLSIENAEEVAEAGSSFALLQEQILTPTCAVSGCHDSRNAVGGLDMSPQVAYKNLVGVESSNPNAKADKLLRVKAGDPYRSFLYAKLDSANLHKTDGYGSPMPLGSRALAAGQLEFIRLWIAAGAPRNGSVVDSKLLADNRPQNEVLSLTPPALGAQFHLTTFGIAPQNEREIFYAERNPQDLYMTSFEMIQRDRSHHFILYAYDTKTASRVPPVGVVRDLYNTEGVYSTERFLEMQNRIFILGSQLKAETISFPEGMAMKLPANWLLDLNSHYTNGTKDTTRGEVVFNIHSTTPDKVKTFVKPLQLGFYNLLLEKRKETVVQTTFLVGAGGSNAQDRLSSPDGVINIIGLTSHTHRLAKKYVIQIVGGKRDGEIVYTCNNWLNPPLVQFKEPIVLRRGEGLKSIVTYYNDNDNTVTFGFRSSDEMNFILGYYY